MHDDADVSWVANLLVSANLADATTVERLSDWLRTDCPWNSESVPPGAKGVGFLKPIAGSSAPRELWGGWKHPESHVWAGALNHASIPAIIDHIGTLPWTTPAAVQLLIQDQEESYFRLYMWRDGRFQQFAPVLGPEEADEYEAW